MEMIHGLPRQDFVRDPYKKAGIPGSGPMPQMPEGMTPPPGMELPEGMGFPPGMTPPAGMTPPPGMELPEGMAFPPGMTPPPGMEPPAGMTPPAAPADTDPFGNIQKKNATSALAVVDGKVVTQEAACEVEGQHVKNLRLRINRDDMGGVYAAGKDTDLTVEHANIHISGQGEGLGGKLSGAYVEDHAKLTLRDCRINMDGMLRCATSAAGNSVLKVYDSTLISHGDPWPADQELVTREVTPKMSNPPYSLEVEGNMRTHCTVQDSESYFYNSTIIADSWAALSTDAAGERVYLEANDCKVITTRSGYGTYADGGCYVVLNRCDLDVACMAAICGGEAGVTLNDCTAKCGSFVVLAHVVGGFGGDEVLTHVDGIEINRGSFRCEDAAVLLKSCNADVVFNNTEIKSHAGVLVKSVYNDFFAAHPAGKKVYGIHVVLKDMNTENDILHEDPERMMEVKFENSTLTGAITGNVLLTMDEASRWTATADSQVVLNGDVGADQIDAPAGVTIQAQGAEAAELTLRSGGKLIVTVK